MGVLLAAFAVGTFWFWALLVLSVVIVTACIETEHGVFAFFTLALAVTILDRCSRLPIASSLLDHPKRTAVLVVAYFVIGAIWGIVKWFFYVHRQLEKYNELKAKVLQNHKATELTPDMAVELQDAVRNYYADVNPQVSEHKADVLTWMSYWPFSAAWTLINDPVRKAFRMIYQYIQGTLQDISDRMFKTANADLALAKQAKVGKNERKF